MPNRPNGGGNRPEPRARGNAPQLHEKYKSMARDAQLAGDRVQTEYYLQFADHYYRILNENRPRFDESRPRQGDNGNDAGSDDYDDDDAISDEGEDDALLRQPPPRARDDRPHRDDRPPREARPDRSDRPQQRDVRSDRDDRPQRDAQPQRGSYVPDGDDRPPRPRRDVGDDAGRGPRNDRSAGDGQASHADVEANEGSREDGAREASARAERPVEARPRARTARSGGEDAPVRAPRVRAPQDAGDDKPGIDFDRLPPAISRSEPSAETHSNGGSEADAGEEERPRPVRRARQPRKDAPAAA